MAKPTCDYCGREFQNNQAKKIHSLSCAQRGETDDDDTIGVTDTQSDAVEEDTYHCGTCKSDLTKGMTQCPTCEVGLDWRGIN